MQIFMIYMMVVSGTVLVTFLLLCYNTTTKQCIEEFIWVCISRGLESMMVEAKGWQ